jgi:Flp pilus assembly pilin Flp
MNHTPVMFKFPWLKPEHRLACSAQTLVEYGMILAFISVVAIAVLKSLGTRVTSLFSFVNNQIDQANSGS